MGHHTPGPWTIQDLGHRLGYPNWRPKAIRCAHANVHLATVGNVDRYYEGERQEANARLIAAAPALLDLVERCAPLVRRCADTTVSHDPLVDLDRDICRILNTLR
mgnify:CR=1 FL=1